MVEMCGLNDVKYSDTGSVYQLVRSLVFSYIVSSCQWYLIVVLILSTLTMLMANVFMLHRTLVLWRGKAVCPFSTIDFIPNLDERPDRQVDASQPMPSQLMYSSWYGSIFCEKFIP
jgi:hypothetical protein